MMLVQAVEGTRSGSGESVKHALMNCLRMALTEDFTRVFKSVWGSMQVFKSLKRRLSLILANDCRSSEALTGSRNEA